MIQRLLQRLCDQSKHIHTRKKFQLTCELLSPRVEHGMDKSHSVFAGDDDALLTSVIFCPDYI